MHSSSRIRCSCGNGSEMDVMQRLRGRLRVAAGSYMASDPSPVRLVGKRTSKEMRMSN